MKLSKSQFEQFSRADKLVLSFIGMSNIGKTYWSQKLEQIGFRHINCDDLIEKKLTPVLKKLGYAGIKDMSKWMGQPYDARFSINQKIYLALEKEVMATILGEIKTNYSGNIVIDTTGSVVHTGNRIMKQLERYSMVIYIEASENMQEQMFKKYLEEPKPVVFGNVYRPKKGENRLETLGRCYKQLLTLRSALYAAGADVIIPQRALTRDVQINQFISLIKQAL